ncbi:hypothetical protein B0H67DRAFT_108687 [Lasiosphaeris hirsuta]|uniref:ZZ-type domain-containing protein n=1 Tax=Lasiosphaeris hirsuta TaxID=260670 RepID=A0AA40E1K9_9PEZI|nr:hypothetical protein B0H67DRAFT_108687 [Lasiosphaeris hirsuta]
MAAAALLQTRFAGQDVPGLYLVHPQDDGRNCIYDIIVVHGLRGGANKTWRHPHTGVVWFQHLLPDLLRSLQADNARIWTFGYPASLAFQTSTIDSFAQNLLVSVNNVRRDRQNRNIIWVCHSLGGIIVKKALIDAAIDGTYQSIRNSTSGIIFLGTPHRGSGAADLGSTVASIAAAAIPGFRIFNRDILKDLRRNNTTLAGISSAFSRICVGMTIHSFYETIPQGGTQLIVDRASAILDLTNESVRVGLNSTHQNMGKFRDAYDHNWSLLASSITDLLIATPSPYQTGPPPGGASNLWFSEDSLSRPATSASTRDGRQRMRQPPGQDPPAQQHSTHSQSQPSQNERAQTLGAYPTLNHAHSRMSLRPADEQHSRSYPEENGSDTGIHNPRLPPPTQRTYDPDDPEAALCDACLGSIRSSEPRVQCTVCYDYDLCLGCFHEGKTSKGHDVSHNISHVSDTQILRYEDLIPVNELVNPPRNQTDGRTNWTIVDFEPGTVRNPTDHAVSSRVLHLFDKNAHARFLAFCKPGHYGIAIDIGVAFHKDLGPQARRTLQQRRGGAGLLCVTFGRAKNNSQFFGTIYNEDSFTDGALTPTSLPYRLLDPLWGAVSQIDLEDKILLQSSRILHLDGESDESLAVGLILQWSGVASFQASKDPVVSLTIENIRLYNIVDYSEPYVRASPPAAEEPTEDEDGPSVEEFLQALLQIQREVTNREEKARLEALLKLELQRQEQAKREAVARLFAQAMQEAVEEAMMEEQRKRQQAELVRFLQALGLQ